MRALVFAAGRGERMRPLSDRTPKPLLRAGGRMLVEWQILALARGGIRELVVNTAHGGAAIAQALGDGARYGVDIAYSREGDTAEDALETLGGIVKALPLLGHEPFAAVSGDIVTAFDYATLATRAAAIAGGRVDAHFVLVDNPPYHPRGDIGLDGGMARLHDPLLTYANIGVFSAAIFKPMPVERRPLFPWAFELIRRGRASAEKFTGCWHNVGTPADLEALDRDLARRQV